jgi:nucleoside phosphorylase
MDKTELEDVGLTSDQMRSAAPILDLKDHEAPSVFLPENMLREARRQKSIPRLPIPAVCILDPDGDLLRQLQQDGATTRCEGWACYHTVLHLFTHAGMGFGIIGCAVGAAFSVLLAEQAFASGCELLISISSAGQITAPQTAPQNGPQTGPPSGPYFILIERALRDEGTSYHYLAPARYALADPALIRLVFAALQPVQPQLYLGASWTTDAPFRETARAIEAARNEGILAVEMEAAALYAFATARRKKLLCFAQVTNQMGRVADDFEKGDANGAHAALDLIALAARTVMQEGFR